MVKNFSVILGIGLSVLWAVGLGSPNATGWLTWLDGIAAVCAFVVASGGRNLGRPQAAGAPFGLAIGLYALWIMGLASDATGWLCWWTFGFACAFTVVAMAASRAPEARKLPLGTEQGESLVADPTRQYTDDTKRVA